jgi:hypothetical protein
MLRGLLRRGYSKSSGLHKLLSSSQVFIRDNHHPPYARSIFSSPILKAFQSDYYDTTVQRYAEMPVDRMTMTRIMSAGTNVNPEKLIVMAQHVQRELSIRLARRLLDMQTLPYVVVANPHIQEVYQMYERGFQRLVAFPKVTNAKLEAEFVELVKALVQEAVQVVTLLARGMHEARRKIRQIDHSTGLDANQFLADMFMSRISRRVIAEQYIALHREQPGFVGIICTQLSPIEVLRRVIPEAALQCQQTYGAVPEVKPRHDNATRTLLAQLPFASSKRRRDAASQVVIDGDPSITCSYIPTHLEYIVFEILKARGAPFRAHCLRHTMPCCFTAAAAPACRRGPCARACRTDGRSLLAEDTAGRARRVRSACLGFSGGYLNGVCVLRVCE